METYLALKEAFLFLSSTLEQNFTAYPSQVKGKSSLYYVLQNLYGISWLELDMKTVE